MNRRYALAGLGAGLAAAAAPRSAFAANDPLHIASIPLDAGAEAYYAYDMGYFRDAGIDATVESIPSGAAILSAVAGGAVDVGFAEPDFDRRRLQAQRAGHAARAGQPLYREHSDLGAHGAAKTHR